jgi:hypothetical protein
VLGGHVEVASTPTKELQMTQQADDVPGKVGLITGANGDTAAGAETLMVCRDRARAGAGGDGGALREPHDVEAQLLFDDVVWSCTPRGGRARGQR